MSYYAAHILRRTGIPESVAHSAASRLTVQSYGARQVIWPKGAEVPSWQFIISGLVAATVPTRKARSAPFALYGPNSWFGEQPILNHMPSELEYACLSATEAFTMPASLLRELFETQAGFARHIARMATWRAQKASETLILMKLGNPNLRTVLGIAQVAEAMASYSEPPVANGQENGIAIPVSQAMLAALCGVSRTVFSECVQPLAGNGWLSISYGRVELLSIATWQRFSSARRVQPAIHTNPTMEELVLEFRRAAEA